jgi:hypothetical protein
VARVADETRCTGGCCREFYLPATRCELAVRALWYLWMGDAFTGLEIARIATMTRIVRMPEVGDLSPGGKPVEVPEPIYSCVHFDGRNCTAYDQRPRMCSGFPYGRPCEYEGCTWETGRLGLHPSIELVLVEADDSKDLVHLPVIQ